MFRYDNFVNNIAWMLVCCTRYDLLREYVVCLWGLETSVSIAILQFRHCICETCEWLKFRFFYFPYIVPIYVLYFVHYRHHNSHLIHAKIINDEWTNSFFTHLNPYGYVYIERLREIFKEVVVDLVDFKMNWITYHVITVYTGIIHCRHVIMSVMAFQIAGVSIVYSIVCSG